MNTLQNIKLAVISGSIGQMKGYVEQALAEGIEVTEIFNDGLIAGMSIVGTRFKKDEIYMPEVLIAARTMHAGLNVLKPLIAEQGMSKKATVVIGTVKGDLHDIGKNIVRMMIEGAGYEVIDLGIDVPNEKFIRAVEDYKPRFLCLSALLTTTIPAMSEIIDDLSKEGLRDRVKVVVGGAPVTQKYADEIGADGYAPDAGSAVDKVNELLVEV